MLFVLIYYIIMSAVFSGNTYRGPVEEGFDFGSPVWQLCNLENGIYDIRIHEKSNPYSFKLTKNGKNYSITALTPQDLKTISILKSKVGTLESLTELLEKNKDHAFIINGPGLDVGGTMIKFEHVSNNLYRLTCDTAPASGGGGMSGRGSHKQRTNTRRRRTYQKKRVSLKRYRRRIGRTHRSRKN